MSMDVYGTLTLVARPKQDLTIKEQMSRNIKHFKEMVVNLPEDDFDSYFQNLLEEYCPGLHRYNFEEDEDLDIKINSTKNLELLTLLDLGLQENVGPKDGYPFKNLFKEKAIKIYDENIYSEEPPFMYGNFLYLMDIDTFNENLDKLNENSYNVFDKLNKIDKDLIIKCFNGEKQSCLEKLKQQRKSLFSNDKEYNKIFKTWSDLTYEDYEFYVAFEGFIN